MSAELVRRGTDGWVDVLPAVGDLAAKVAGTDFVPEALRNKPAAIAAAILYGREVGMEPMTALRSINVIKGKPALSAEAMRALVLAAGHDIRFVDMTATRCVIEGRRRGQDEPTRVTYSMDDAKKAGLAGQSQYSKMPRQMLAARATAELCRLIFADVIGGLIADVEVLDDVEPVPVAVPSTTMQRSRRPRGTEPEPVAEPTAEPTADEPLIPDDDDVVDAEVVEDKPTAAAVKAVQDTLGADVIAEVATPTTGPALLRQALADAKAGKTKPSKLISPQQMSAMQAVFREVCDDWLPEQRREIARVLCGRDVLASASDLTGDEASAVIDGLRLALATADPRATIEEAVR